MKTKKIIALYLTLFLTGIAVSGFPQGITNSGGYITGSSTSYIKFSGSSDMTLKSTTADRTTFGNMVVDFTGSGTYKLTLKDDSYLTVNGTLTMNDDFVLESTSSSTASLITGGSNTGNITVQRYLTEEKWHYVSPPISNATLDVFHFPSGHSDVYVKRWDEPNCQWVYMSTVTDPLNVEQGYAVWVDDNVVQDETIIFKGSLNSNVTSTFSLTYSLVATNSDTGWNLVGNPYPSALDWDQIPSGDKVNIDNTIYYWNPASGSGNYSYYVGSGTAPWTGGTSVNDGTKYIPAMQGYIVHCNNSAGGSIKMDNTARVHNSQAYYKNTDNYSNFLRLKATGNGYWDELIIRFFQGATEGFDTEFDAYKLFGLNAAPQLYSINGYLKQCVNTLPKVSDGLIIPLGFKVGAAGKYSFSSSGLESFNPNIIIYLEDKGNATGLDKIINLKLNPVYTFSAKPNDDPDRFLLHFYDKDIDTEDNVLPDSGSSGNAKIYSYENNIYVNLAADMLDISENYNGEIVVYNLIGQEITRKTVENASLHKISIDDVKGYYIVKVLTNNNIITEKVFIE
ncbi:MAG: T9SS type A sorting domain-containing protein [Bacteroidales bacterium]|nr:T9SS type A sorting domain-containing protein [Bacteroidales bacterium]